MGYYILTLLICSVVHEFGHAVTSVSDDVTVIGAGIVVMVFVPAAYVELVKKSVVFKKCSFFKLYNGWKMLEKARLIFWNVFLKIPF